MFVGLLPLPADPIQIRLASVLLRRVTCCMESGAGVVPTRRLASYLWSCSELITTAVPTLYTSEEIEAKGWEVLF